MLLTRQGLKQLADCSLSDLVPVGRFITNIQSLVLLENRA